jgi:hypothetical protein
MVLKVTNDKECFKYASDNVADIKNLDRLTGWFLSQASRREVQKSKAGGGGGGGGGGGAGAGAGAGGVDA